MTELYCKTLAHLNLLKALRVIVIAGVLVATICAPSFVAAADVDGFGP